MTALLVLPFLAGAPVPPDPKKADDGLEGVWILKEREASGRKYPNPAGSSVYTLVVAGDRYAFRTHGGKLSFDAKNKRHVDMNVDSGRYKDRVVPGIYERDGDTLKLAIPTSMIAANMARPEDMKTAPTARVTIYTFERERDTKRKDIEEQLNQRFEILKQQENAVNGNPFQGR